MANILQSERMLAREKCYSPSKAQKSAILHNDRMKNVSPEDQKTGNRLKAWREHKGFTQEELAEKVGTVSGQISLLENGHRHLSVKWLYRLADALEITPGWLLDRHPDEIPPDIHDIWGSIPRAQHEVVRDVLRAFRHPPSKDGTNG